MKIQKGVVEKSYMTNGLGIYDSIFAHFRPVPATVVSTGVPTTCDLHRNTLAISMC